ncbi:MAG: hypothetical protein R3324_10320, partial [Halobacteriales archaeon]|nr:hypothetical protein [Halobacteriales archaeon]
MKIHGKDTYFAFGDSGDTLQDFSDHMNSVERANSRSTAESTGFSPSGNFRTYVAGLRDGTISVEGQYDGAASQVDEVLEDLLADDTPKSWDFAPEGNTSGNRAYGGGPNTTVDSGPGVT